MPPHVLIINLLHNITNIYLWGGDIQGNVSDLASVFTIALDFFTWRRLGSLWLAWAVSIGSYVSDSHVQRKRSCRWVAWWLEAEKGMFSSETRLRRCSDTSTVLNFTVQTRRKPTMKEIKPLMIRSLVPVCRRVPGSFFCFFLRKDTLLLLNCVDCALLIRKYRAYLLAELIWPSDVSVCYLLLI